VAIGLDYKLEIGQREGEGDQEYKDRLSRLHDRSARRFLWLFRTLGGLFVKLGQHLSALVYLLPPEYIETLKVLQDEAPRSRRGEIERVIREDWGGELSEYFAEFSEEPEGSASLAQVHRGRLWDGQEVAVKVQHLRVGRFARGDAAIVGWVVEGIKRFFPEFNFDWLAQELKVNLPLEMDFVHEGANAERARRNFADSLPDLVVPRVIWPLTSSRILTMEFTPGRKVSDADYLKEHGIDPSRVAKLVAEVFAKMIFVDGFVHADPHAGNIFVRPKKDGIRGEFQVVLLDHGLYREVERKIRLDYANLWASIIAADEQGMSKYCTELGVGHLYQLVSCMLTSRLWLDPSLYPVPFSFVSWSISFPFLSFPFPFLSFPFWMFQGNGFKWRSGDISVFR